MTVMIANVQLHPNVLPASKYPSYFQNLSAYEMYSISQRFPMLVDKSAFAPGGETKWPGPHQWKEWCARLFWGDNQVTMEVGSRCHWVQRLGLVQKFLEKTESDLRQSVGEMDSETAFELFCLLWIFQAEEGGAVSRVKDLTDILKQRMKNQDLTLTDAYLEERLREVTGFKT